MRGEVSKYLFIDSSVHNGRVSLPSQPFSCVDNESMSFTLLNFSMRRNFPQINPTNNHFYIYLSDKQTLFEVVISPGDYDDFASLTSAINDALTQTVSDNVSLSNEVTSIVCAFVSTTRTFAFTIAMNSGASSTVDDVEIRSYHIKDGNVPTGVTHNGAYSDSFEILGANPLKKDEDKNSMSRDAANNAILYSQFPASLSTLDALYLRMNLELGNYESPGLDMFHRDGVQMQNSSVIARIPIADSVGSVRKAHEIITFEDANDTYQKLLPLKHLEHLEFFVTDKRNRSLATFDPKQSSVGLMSFNLTLRWDKFIPQKPAHPIPNGFPKQTYPPSYGYGKPRV
jgi:hypothetical protein